jgi:outer membrane murein-binding lipoprotein Lpp
MAKKTTPSVAAVDAPKQEAPAPAADPIRNMLQKISGMNSRVAELRVEVESLASEIAAVESEHADKAGAAVVTGSTPPPEPQGLSEKKSTLASRRRVLAAAERSLAQEVDALRRSAQSELGARHRRFEAAAAAYGEFLRARLTKLLLLFGEIQGDVSTLEMLNDSKHHVARQIVADIRGIREAENRGLQSGMAAAVSVAAQGLVQLAGAPTAEVFDRVLALESLMAPWAEVQKQAEAKLEKIR